jgi:hypothetical protein
MAARPLLSDDDEILSEYDESFGSDDDVDYEKGILREIGMAQRRAMVDEERKAWAQYRQEMNEFNEHLTSIIKPELVDKSNISNTNISSLLNIVFPDIPQLNGVALVVPFPKDWKLWPHYKYDEIFSCIEKQYPQITSPEFKGKTYGVRIYVDGKDVREPGAHQTTDIPNEATVELRYRPFAPSKEEVWAAAGLPVDSAYEKLHNLERAAVSSSAPSVAHAAHNNTEYNWRDDEWEESWDYNPAASAHAASPGPAPAAPGPAPAAPGPAQAAPATIERVAMALWDTLPPPLSDENWNGKKQRALKAAAALLDGKREAVLESLAIVLWDTLPPPLSDENWNGKKQRALKAAAALLDARAAAPADPFPPILHPISNTMMTYDHKSRKYVEPILNGTSGKWMIYNPASGNYSEPLAPWSGAPTPGTATQGLPPMVYPGTGQQTEPFKSGGKKPQSKRGKKKSKSKTKTKKSKSKSKRNKRRSYKRVK